ncbi:hypothetical protein ONZ45_g6273 [Pleurotus djamor]|nr:hypothetical protein ONZ45_g6273 [Pleurotus djamor]
MTRLPSVRHEQNGIAEPEERVTSSNNEEVHQIAQVRQDPDTNIPEESLVRIELHQDPNAGTESKVNFLDDENDDDDDDDGEPPNAGGRIAEVHRFDAADNAVPPCRTILPSPLLSKTMPWIKMLILIEVSTLNNDNLDEDSGSTTQPAIETGQHL